jgi:hypothetical protein
MEIAELKKIFLKQFYRFRLYHRFSQIFLKSKHIEFYLLILGLPKELLRKEIKIIMLDT